MENINSHIPLLKWKLKCSPKDKSISMKEISGLPNKMLYSAPPFFLSILDTISDINWKGNPYEDEAELS